LGDHRNSGGVLPVDSPKNPALPSISIDSTPVFTELSIDSTPVFTEDDLDYSYPTSYTKPGDLNLHTGQKRSSNDRSNHISAPEDIIDKHIVEWPQRSYMRKEIRARVKPRRPITHEGGGFRILPNVINKIGVTSVGQPEICVGEDVPCTDSGYASAPNLDHSSKIEKIMNNSGDSTPQQPMASSNSNTDDAKTIYSEATTLMPDIVWKSIVDVCNEIYNSLGQKVNDRNWASTSGILPSLIKAFAVKLGSESSSESNLRIMRFIHKHHQYVLSCPTTPTRPHSPPIFWPHCKLIQV
jgi:hypothetical protein